ncbi:MAG: hypothetical protein P8I51_07165 [Polaribacter sp.]|nr:hypothetical protein [Polaribacter sp.]MDG2074691.1 hypothetical protein [Polaribacter sp.]
MINSLQFVSITDFILSLICIFLAGILFGKAKTLKKEAKLLCYFFFFAGLAAFAGGIDHGFFEPINQRFIPTTITYLSVALATFFIFNYTIATFFKGGVVSVLRIIAIVQLLGFSIASFYYHNFILVVANYSPILLLFLAMNSINIKKGKSELNFTLFCVILIIATLVQVLGIDLSETINSDTLYHIIAFVAYFFLYFGVSNLKPNEVT